MPSLDVVTEADGPPQLLTVDEAARLLRIGRSRAYELANEYLNTGGTTGIPVYRLGPGCLRIPRWALIELATTGRVVRLCDAVVLPTGATVAR
jgi:Helix-turn-helix domain